MSQCKEFCGCEQRPWAPSLSVGMGHFSQGCSVCFWALILCCWVLQRLSLQSCQTMRGLQLVGRGSSSSASQSVGSCFPCPEEPPCSEVMETGSGVFSVACCHLFTTRALSCSRPFLHHIPHPPGAAFLGEVKVGPPCPESLESLLSAGLGCCECHFLGSLGFPCSVCLSVCLCCRV